MNPIEYIEKCTLYDLLKFQEETKYVDKNHIERKATKTGELIFIAYLYMNISVERMAIVFELSKSAVKSTISQTRGKGLTEMDRLDDLMREIAYWKYKQLNKLHEGKI